MGMQWLFCLYFEKKKKEVVSKDTIHIYAVLYEDWSRI